MVKIKFNKDELLAYFILFVSVYMSGNVMLADSSYMTIRIFLHLSLLGSVFLAFLKSGIDRKLIIIISFTLMYFGICLLVYSDAVFHLFLKIVWFIGFCGFGKFCYKKSISCGRILYRIITAISVWSFIFYILVNVLHLNIPYIIVDTGIQYRVYFGIYAFRDFIAQTIGPIKFYEYCSIFWEHGIYGLYLTYGLYYLLFVKTQRLSYMILFYCINILLTFSTTACALMVILLGLYYIQTLKLKIRSKLLISAPILLGCIMTMFWVFSVKKNSPSPSYSLRVNDIVNGLKAFLVKPVFGSGFHNYEFFFEIQGNNRGNSNGLVTFLFTMGIVGMALLIAPLLYNFAILCKNKCKYTLNYLVFVALMLIINMSEMLLEMPIMMFWIACEYRGVLSSHYLRKFYHKWDSFLRRTNEL